MLGMFGLHKIQFVRYDFTSQDTVCVILHKIFVGYDFTSHDTVCEMIYWKHVSVISRGSVLIGLSNLEEMFDSQDNTR